MPSFCQLWVAFDVPKLYLSTWFGDLSYKDVAIIMLLGSLF